MLTMRKMRKTLRNRFGYRSYRITSTGDIHVKGRMPNTDTVGWYIFGHTLDPATIDDLEDRRLRNEL